MLEELFVLAIAVVFVLVVIAGSFAVAMLYRRRFGHAIWVKFLRRTGYRRKADPNAPIEQQAQAILEDIFRLEGAIRGPWIRDVDGLTLTYSSWLHNQGDESVTQESWQLELPADSQINVQLIDRRLAKPGRLQKLCVAPEHKRRLGELLPHELRTEDRRFDERFLVRADNADTLPAFLSDSEVRQVLQDLPAVCIVVAQREIVLDDLEGSLRRKHVGMALTPRQMMLREPSAHDQVARMLSTLWHAIRTR